MPRGVYTRRPRVPKAVNIEDDIAPVAVNEDVDLPITETLKFPEQEAAPKAASFVSAPPSCAMTERKWQGKYPVWQCPKCRVDTLDPALAKKARRACRK